MMSLKKVMPFLLAAALFGSVYYHINDQTKIETEYTEALEAARHYSELGAHSDAIAQYGVALELKRSLPLLLEIGEIYLQEKQDIQAERWYEDTLLAEYPQSPETYLYGLRLYEQRGFLDEMFSVYDKYQKRGLTMEEVEALVKKYWYFYELKGSYDDVGTFSSVSGLAPAMHEGRWGLVNTNGTRSINYLYASIGSPATLAAAETQDGRSIYVDTSGNEKINENFILEKDAEFNQVLRFQNLYSGLIPAYNGTVWNYYDSETFEKRFGGYSDVTSISNGVGAATQDGNRWFLLSPDGQSLTDARYDAVLADGMGVLCRNDVLIVREGDDYRLIHSNGEPVGAQIYSDAKAFNDSTMAAVKSDGKWTFVDQEGGEHDLGDYEDACSFSNGLAAVKIDGNWGYIDTEGQLVIAAEFMDAGPFYNGVAFVRISEEAWVLLSLIRLHH